MCWAEEMFSFSPARRGTWAEAGRGSIRLASRTIGRRALDFTIADVIRWVFNISL
jgi:hypothetical protein